MQGQALGFEWCNAMPHEHGDENQYSKKISKEGNLKGVKLGRNIANQCMHNGKTYR